jgi:hypothetical protein
MPKWGVAVSWFSIVVHWFMMRSFHKQKKLEEVSSSWFTHVRVYEGQKQYLLWGNDERDYLEGMVSTVKIHVEHILAKFGVSDRTQAAVRAVELGLIHSSSRE